MLPRAPGRTSPLAPARARREDRAGGPAPGQSGDADARDRWPERIRLFRLVRAALLRPGRPGTVAQAAAGAGGGVRRQHFADYRGRPADPQLRPGPRFIFAGGGWAPPPAKLEDGGAPIPPRGCPP